MFFIEDLDTEDCVEFWVSTYDTCGGNGCIDFLSLAVFNYILSSFVFIMVPETLVKTGSNIVKDMTISLPVNHIWSQILYNFGAPILFNVVI